MTSQEMIQIGEVHLESNPNSGNMVVLKEAEDAEFYFLMFVGDSEFAAIAKEKGMVVPKRPLTHELYLSILEKLPLQFQRIEIHDMREETYFANIILRSNDEEHSIDSRPSDAVALALNQKIPILVRKDLFRRKLSEKEVKDYEGIVKSVKF